MTYNDLCDNGCPMPRYTARRVCKRCVADESLARKRASQGEPAKRGRPAREDGNAIRKQNMDRPLEGFDPFANDWAKRPLRASV